MSVFLHIPEEEVLYRDSFFFIISDRYLVSPGHLLIISCAERTDYFTLTPAEQQRLSHLLVQAKHLVEREFQPNGYNIGMNCGPAVGQTVLHFHCHPIPRYAGDMAEPRGGIRHCVADTGYYYPYTNSLFSSCFLLLSYCFTCTYA